MLSPTFPLIFHRRSLVSLQGGMIKSMHAVIAEASENPQEPELLRVIQMNNVVHSITYN